jgi:hypothetical protein
MQYYQSLLGTVQSRIAALSQYATATTAPPGGDAAIMSAYAMSIQPSGGTAVNFGICEIYIILTHDCYFFFFFPYIRYRCSYIRYR